jgi:membrane protein implicated in regulation of membrane protease activity
MEYDAGGGLWFIIDVIAVAILAVAMIYGTMRWRKRRRSPAVEQRRDQATRDLYRREQS